MAPDVNVEELILRIHCADGREAQTALLTELTEGGAELAERIAATLPSLDGEDAAAACWALSVIGPDAKSALPALEQVAARRSMLVVRSHEATSAERAMVCIRADEPQFVLEALASQKPGLRMGAVDAIAQGRVELSDAEAESVAATLTKMLDARDWGTAGRAVHALNALGARAAPALPRLSELAMATDPPDDPAGIRRLTFVQGLGPLGENGLTVGPVLSQLLTDRNEYVRQTAARLLRRVGPQSADAIPALLRALTYESPPVGMAGPGFAEMSEELQQSVREGLEEARRTHQVVVRAAATRALGELGEPGERVLPALAQATRSTAVRLRYQAVTALGQIGVVNDEVAAALDRALASDTAGHVRRAAAHAMGRMSWSGAHKISALGGALADVQTRKSAAWALKRSGEAALPAAPALIDALDTNERRRMVVVRALAAIGDEVLHDLRAGMHRDDKWRRIGCAEAVAEFGSAAQEMEPTLRELLFDRRPDVREAAEEALEAISGDSDAQRHDTDADETDSSANEQTDEEMHSDGT